MFIYYFLQTLKLATYAGGSAVLTLNRNHIHTLNVHVPKTVEEQEKIVSKLVVFDNRIKINERINDILPPCGIELQSGETISFISQISQNDCPLL